MKPHRIAVAHNLVLNYGLTSKMKVSNIWNTVETHLYRGVES